MFYGIRVNSAIARMGIMPAAVPAQVRKDSQNVGEIVGNSPQEVAIFNVAHMSLTGRAGFDPAPIRDWIESGTVDPEAPEMRNAFEALGLWNLVQ